MDTDTLISLLALALIAAALIGMRDLECNDSNCKSVHKQHIEREREAKALALHRASHKHYYAAWCSYCRERKDGGYE